ncbi:MULTISPECIES: CC0125/CC1285 family lipoprotein [unclassified Acinetobacter]|uniref:CC0125/CC1285 family lipoprotein n=1 Tax=unclassified Acinetobacter TaxID=196816 RepID=UPI002934AF80|nr:MULTISPECIES: hypothetical protein [unclassified Acinetobacter]WOE30938.1 hypothetical protein QSG84_11365 [Acinetobacter sp. SAAs470]WOE39134.1 hypothetical protein QSG86_05030 [Acinetobacter sp. SAAs474]
MKKFPIGLCILFGVYLSGCTLSPSRPLDLNQLGQFNRIALNQNTYRISFQTDARISYATAQEITLVKAAQVTLENGFQFFKVLDNPNTIVSQPPRQAVVYPAPPIYYPPPYYGRFSHPWPMQMPYPYYTAPQVVNIEPTQVAYSIECFKYQADAPDDAFNATLILKSIGAKYGISETGKPLAPNAAQN